MRRSEDDVEEEDGSNAHSGRETNNQHLHLFRGPRCLFERYSLSAAVAFLGFCLGLSPLKSVLIDVGLQAILPDPSGIVFPSHHSAYIVPRFAPAIAGRGRKHGIESDSSPPSLGPPT